ncbi:MAG TPA: ABC transporter permease [Candidatus Polarisedimenticolia bacterium]|nr:ABC transporter permease [Candidatus Polarisedimenticolia bacterium]
MGALIRDIRFALRYLRKEPAFTAVAVLTLALGIGANSAIFSAVNALLLRPLPVKEPARLVLVRDVQPVAGEAPASYPEFLDWKERAKTFQDLAAYFNTTFPLTGAGEPEQLSAVRMSTSMLSMLGEHPPLGRDFRPEEESPDAERVALISRGLWHRRFGGSPEMIGKKILLAGDPFSVIGILPDAFPFGGHPDVVIPLRVKSEWAVRGLHFITVVGRLRSGPDMAQARTELETVTKALRSEGVTKHGIAITPLQDYFVSDTRPALLILFGAVGMVLLIACANIANLLLARGAGRRKEIAIRMAVGASRARLVRQFLTESVLLASLGGCLGLGMAAWGVDLLVASAPAALPRLNEIRIDGWVLGFTAMVSLLTGLLFGLAPALQAGSADQNDSLKEGGRAGGGAPRQRLRALLVVGEVAISLVLLIGAGLLVRSFLRVTGDDRGFDGSRVLTATLALPNASYSDTARQTAFYAQLVEKVGALPDVEAAGIVSHLPLGGDNTNSGLLIEGKTFPDNEPPLADDRLVSPDYFRAMGIPILKGRGFTEHDDASAPQVALINETLARKFFPGEDPIGKRIGMNWKMEGLQEVVGVVKDVRHDGLDLPLFPTVYVPYRQAIDPGMTLVVRARNKDPLQLSGAVRAQVHAIDPNQPISSLRTMDEVASESVGPRRFSTTLFGAFAALALFLAALGIYGVIAYSVTQRTHEIGIRMALGARRRDVLRLVIGQGLQPVGIGVLAGLLAALPLTRLLSGLLFGVGATDPWTFAGIPLLLAGIGLLACYFPARRAAAVDPLTALRHE